MGKRGRPMEWTDSQVRDAKYLMAHNFTASRIGEIFNTTKNAVLGVLYRDKVKNGYVPPSDSKFAVPKKRQRIKSDPS